MHTIAAHWGAAVRFGLVLLLIFGASGCPKEAITHPAGTPAPKKTRAVNCDQKITVDPNKGAYPVAVFLCEDDTVTWDPNGHQFQVVFNAGSPFVGGQTTFDNNNLSGTVKHHYDQLEVYKYTITIDKTIVFDPQVVGGGNP